MKKRITYTEWEGETKEGQKFYGGHGKRKFSTIDLFDKGLIKHPDPISFLNRVKISLSKTNEFIVKLPGEKYSRNYPSDILGRQNSIWDTFRLALENDGTIQGTDKQRERLNKALVKFFNEHCGTIIPEHIKIYKKERVGIFRLNFQVQKIDVYEKIQHGDPKKRIRELSGSQLLALIETVVKNKNIDLLHDLIVEALNRQIITREEANHLEIQCMHSENTS